jgi:ribosome-interacting GTPase 1
MPANLTPDYEHAEQRYREAAGDEEKLAALREMFSTIPKHKGTEKLQADLKRKISQFRKTVAKKPAKGPDPFHVPRSGAGQVVLIGTPNVGKSALVGRLTHAPVKVTEYPFATPVPVPGMCAFEDVQIELVDTPPISTGHVPGGLLGTIRNGDVVAIVLDASEDPLEESQTILEALAARGLALRSVSISELDPSDPNQHATVLVANKIDISGAPENVAALTDLYAGQFQVLPVCATSGEGLDRLVRRLWELLSVVRVYTREPGQHAADTGKPFTLPIGSTVEDLAREIHRELPEKMKFARMWGEGRHPGQQVHRTEVLHDRETVEIHQ